MTLLAGAFHTSFDARDKNYCSGNIEIHLDQNLRHDLDIYYGTLVLEYTGQYRPPPPVPNPLPKLPIVAKKNVKGGFDIEITPTFWQPWLLFASMLGIQVEVFRITDYQNIKVHYSVNGNFFVPKDQGECTMHSVA